MQILKDQPWLGAGMAFVIVAIAVWRPWAGEANAVGGRWYFDLNSGELVTADSKELPPITLDSGHLAVLAYVYACGECANESNRFIGYLERYTDSFKEDVRAGRPPGQGDAMEARMAAVEVAAAPRDGESPQWVAMMSPAASHIRNVGQRCPDGKAVSCLPD